jgi:transcriptional regulator with XRE-family HTH domain
MTDCRLLLARNMKKYRRMLGLSQSALAEKVNCSTTLIGNIEIKKRFPSSKNIDRIAKALGVKPGDLFAEGDNSEAIGRFSDRQKRKVQLERDVMKAISKAFSESNL